MLNASIKGHAEMKCLKTTDPSPATRAACADTGMYFHTAGERAMDHFNMTSSVILCFIFQSVVVDNTVLKLSPNSLINSDKDSLYVKKLHKYCGILIYLKGIGTK